MSAQMHGCGGMYGGGMMGHGPGMGMGMHRGAPWARGPLGFRRRFITRQERIEWLEAYLSNLRQEAKAVEEALEELKRMGPPQSGTTGVG
ncbi:MAG: hypothetical protein AB1609_02020 [Bacillota bacterium]